VRTDLIVKTRTEWGLVVSVSVDGEGEIQFAADDQRGPEEWVWVDPDQLLEALVTLGVIISYQRAEPVGVKCGVTSEDPVAYQVK
jgi:hypothetical protein